VELRLFYRFVRRGAISDGRGGNSNSFKLMATLNRPLGCHSWISEEISFLLN